MSFQKKKATSTYLIPKYKVRRVSFSCPDKLSGRDSCVLLYNKKATLLVSCSEPTFLRGILLIQLEWVGHVLLLAQPWGKLRGKLEIFVYPSPKEATLTYLTNKSLPRFACCSAIRIAEREIFTFAYVSDSKGSQPRFSSCSAERIVEREILCVSFS